MKCFPATRWITGLAWALASLAAHAHGDEPHGDAPHPAAAGAATPRFETATEAFEIVGRLAPGALVIWLQRFATSEPVAQAQVELESGSVKAAAAYDPALGVYVVKDAGFVQAVSSPGEYPVVLTVQVGQEADLLEAVLRVAATDAQEAPATRIPALAAGAGVLAAVVAAALLLRRRRAQGERA